MVQLSMVFTTPHPLQVWRFWAGVSLLNLAATSWSVARDDLDDILPIRKIALGFAPIVV